MVRRSVRARSAYYLGYLSGMRSVVRQNCGSVPL